MHPQGHFTLFETPIDFSNKHAYFTCVMLQFICCRVGCALPPVSGGLEQRCCGGSMVWNAGELQAIL